MQSIRKVHTLKFLHLDESLGVHHRRRSYVVGFLSPSEALYTSRHITKNVQISLGNYMPVMKTRRVETEAGNEIIIVLDSPVPITISKEYSPQFDWVLEEKDVQTFMNIPMMYNLGLIMPFQKTDETNDSITYSSYIVDPIRDVTMFRYGLQPDL